MTLDVYTLMVVLAISSFISSATLVFLRAINGNLPGLTYWSWTFITTTIGVILIMLRPIAPAFISADLGSVFALASYFCSVVGYIQYNRIRLTFNPIWMVIVPSLIMLLIFISTDSVKSKVIIFSSLVAVISAVLAEFIWRNLPGVLGKITSGIWFYTAIFYLFRIYSWFGVDPVVQTMTEVPEIEVITYGFGTLFGYVLTLNLIILINRSLQLRMSDLAKRDALTGLFNRRGYFEQCEAVLGSSNRVPCGVSFLQLDLDYFKQVNDEYGHNAGDNVLRAFADTTALLLRPNDVFCRWGGEEFLIMLPDTNESQAKAVAERIRNAYAKISFSFEGEKYHGSVSIGLVSTHQEEAHETLVGMADQALYRAKQNGRDQVVLY